MNTVSCCHHKHTSTQSIEQIKMLLKFYKAHTAFSPVRPLTLPQLTDSPLPSRVSCVTIFMIKPGLNQFYFLILYAYYQYYQKAKFNKPVLLHCTHAQKIIIHQYFLNQNNCYTFKKQNCQISKIIKQIRKTHTWYY